MNLIDTHAHLTYEGLAERLDDVLARSIDAGVTRWITVGTKIADNEDTLLLISRHDNLWGALGYHPHEADDVTDADMELLKKPGSSLSAKRDWTIITCTRPPKISSVCFGSIWTSLLKCNCPSLSTPARRGMIR
jgi:Tat protein secretion system quality control protein TatD with DNase activity